MNTVEYRISWQRDARKFPVKRRVHTEPKPGRDLRNWAAVYRVIGLAAGIVIFAQAGNSQTGRFLLYLVCANVAASSSRPASHSARARATE